MKKSLFMVMLSMGLSSQFSYADTCPLPDQFTLPIPPAGWTILMPAIFPGDNYHFVSATHSLNSTYYNLQVICRYECSPDAKDCSPFTLLSNATYQQPTTNKAPWNLPPLLVYTVVCIPPDKNPLECVFSNMPNNNSLVLNEIQRQWRTVPEKLLFG